MTILNLANTQFEFELRQEHTLSLNEGLHEHPVFLQLQFMPFLYAQPSEYVGITHQPSPEYWKKLQDMGWDDFPRMLELDQPSSVAVHKLLTWGWSRQVLAWARSRGIIYVMPEWKVIREVNSKAFSFVHSPALSGSRLLHNEEELKSWYERRTSSLVLKSCYGVSGRGKLLLPADQEPDWNAMRIFCSKEWKSGLPVIGEPWVERIFDFSTQWEIIPTRGIDYLGAMVMQNDARGTYQGTLVGPESELFGEHRFFLSEHRGYAMQILSRMEKMGFWGNVGIDAMIYQDPKAYGKPTLHPIVEVNARQTMSLIALRIQRRRFSNQRIKMTYASHPEPMPGLLPTELISKKDGKLISFTKQLLIETNPKSTS